VLLPLLYSLVAHEDPVIPPETEPELAAP
jgi:hypothetical protein